MSSTQITFLLGSPSQKRLEHSCLSFQNSNSLHRPPGFLSLLSFQPVIFHSFSYAFTHSLPPPPPLPPVSTHLFILVVQKRSLRAGENSDEPVCIPHCVFEMWRNQPIECKRQVQHNLQLLEKLSPVLFPTSLAPIFSQADSLATHTHPPSCWGCFIQSLQGPPNPGVPSLWLFCLSTQQNWHSWSLPVLEGVRFPLWGHVFLVSLLPSGSV